MRFTKCNGENRNHRFLYGPRYITFFPTCWEVWDTPEDSPVNAYIASCEKVIADYLTPKGVNDLLQREV